MSVRILVGDALAQLQTLPDRSVQTCVTSPPYWKLREYGVDGQIGQETTPEEYVEGLVWVFREVRRVLTDSGTLWLNLGDSRDGGCLTGIPWRVAFALVDDDWLLVNDVVWHKPNIVPVNAPRRLTCDHESLFFFAKLRGYHFDGSAIQEPLSENSIGRYRYAFTGGDGRDGRLASQAPAGMKEMPDARNRRTVWTIPASNFQGGHFATFPPKLVEPCVLSCTRHNDTVLDPFGGAGTTGLVADRLGRDAILIELNEKYAAMARERIASDAPLFTEVDVA